MRAHRSVFACMVLKYHDPHCEHTATSLHAWCYNITSLAVSTQQRLACTLVVLCVYTCSCHLHHKLSHSVKPTKLSSPTTKLSSPTTTLSSPTTTLSSQSHNCEHTADALSKLTTHSHHNCTAVPTQKTRVLTPVIITIAQLCAHRRHVCLLQSNITSACATDTALEQQASFSPSITACSSKLIASMELTFLYCNHTRIRSSRAPFTVERTASLLHSLNHCPLHGSQGSIGGHLTHQLLNILCGCAQCKMCVTNASCQKVRISI